MKKTMSAVVSLLLALSMLLGLTACGESAPAGGNTLVGKWECTLDFADMLNEMLGAQLGTTIDSFSARMTFEFTEDGKATLALDEQYLKDQIPGFVDDLMGSMASQMGMSADDIYAMSGMTRDQFVAQMETTMMQSMNVSTVNGTYETEGDKLWVISNGSSKNEEEPVIYSFENGKLLLNPAEGSEVPEMLEGFLPLTLTRI